MLSKKWTKWGLLLAGSTFAALNLGACVAQYLVDTFILRSVN